MISLAILNFNSSKISIQSGYSFYIDAGNLSSYSGSGATWTDLNSGAIVALSGSPTFDTDGGGSLVFNGSTQWGSFDYTSIFDLSGPSGYCYEVWVKFSNFSNGMVPFSKGLYGSSYDWGLYIPDASDISQWTSGTIQQLNLTLSTPFSAGTWYHLCSTGDISTTTIYVNGVSIGSGPLTITNTDISTPAGMAPGYGPNLPTNFGLLAGKLSIARLYQTALSATQVLTNFNAQKSRFGY